MRATSSTKRLTTAPGQLPRRTSRAWPSGRVPDSGHRQAGRHRQPTRAPRRRSRPLRQCRRPAQAPAPSGQQNLFGAPGTFDEPDLFSELEDEPAAAPAGTSPEAVVESLERELLQPETRADLGRTAVLLHPDFTEIGVSGRIWTRDAMMMALEDNPGGPVELELLGADRLGEKTVLLTYRSHTREGSALRSSLWVLEGAQWRLRFHQGTPEA